MKSNLKQKISFVELLTAILYFLYGKEHGDKVYAYYEGYANSLFRCDMDLVKSQPLHKDLLSAIALLDHIAFKDGIQYFEALRNFPDPIFETLALPEFLSQKQHFYENRGEKKSSANNPATRLYFNSKVIDYLYQTDSKSVINHNIVKSALAKQLETIGKQIEKENYKVTTVKKLANDILRNLYPNMTEHEQNFVWRFFKNDES